MHRLVYSLIVFAGTSVAAQVSAVPTSSLGKLTSCRAITDNTVRLACFDAAAADIADASKKNDLVVMDRQDIQQMRRGLFGFSLPRLPLFGNSDGKGDNARPRIEPIQEIDSTIMGLSGTSSGLWRMTLEDGSEWETIEPWRTTLPARGDKLSIRRNGIGTYFLKVADGKGVKAIRRR